MKISDIATAKGLKFRLKHLAQSTHFSAGALIRIETTQKEREFLISQYGTGITQTAPVLCTAGDSASQYLHEIFAAEQGDSTRCMFVLEGAEESSLEVQAYTFRSITEYKTTIFIQVPEKISAPKLYRDYVWEQLGEPALFCLNYRDRKKQDTDIRFLSGKRCLVARNTPRGIIVRSENYLHNRDSVPIDVYIAPKIEFIPETDAARVNDGLAADLDRISNPASYFARWEAYHALSKKLQEQEQEEFGTLRYASYTQKSDLSGIIFEFHVEGELDPSFLGRELAASEARDGVESGRGEAHTPRPAGVGAIKKISGGKLTTYLELTYGFDTIPDSGCLTLHMAGNKSIMARREAARDRMLKRRSPICSLVALIEAGPSRYELASDWGSHRAVTQKLKRNFSKAAALNPEQVKALEIAINTPDIALIQGPPGTGKTTVIKAICQRFREIYEEEERREQKEDPDHVLCSPKILISSFQNDAVDNAISAPLPGDIPAYRKTSRRAKEGTRQQYEKALERWYTDVYNSINGLITNNAAIEFAQQRKLLSDEYLSYKNSGESLTLAAELMNHYLSFPEIHYPQNLMDGANAVIRAARSSTEAENFPDPIVAKLEAQRTDLEAFADDGRMNAKRLAAHLRIRGDLEIDAHSSKAINDVCGEQVSDEAFTRYVQAVKQLQQRFCRRSTSMNPRDKQMVNGCLTAMSTYFTDQYMKTLSDMESKKSLILSEFLTRLEQEYEVIVRKYSTTTAATCQTCLDLRDGAQKVFDLVVIDEAARANPLDLFIPMSMGRKIVLVGDHRQLPHMLEPDVLKVLQEDPKFKDLPEIEKSLFERLFGMFSTGMYPKAVLLTHQFRMHPEICKFVSEIFYDGKLVTSDTVTPEMRSSPLSINSGKALTFVNIPITKGAETPGASKTRSAEVDAIGKDIKLILDADKKAEVGIITFYAAQVSKIRQRLEILLDSVEISRVEVGTVDAFQGKEFDYVMLSCVRSNMPQDGGLHSVGFLERPNRLCVAFSRAIRQLIVYGDEQTLIQIPCFSRLCEICALEEGGCYREY